MKWQTFSLRQVELRDANLLRARETNKRYLLSFDTDRLLWTFRQNAGLPTPGEPLGGWEAPSCEVRGQFIGHYMSACALMFESTGDEALKAKGDTVVAGLAACQQSLGGKYLSAFPETFWDRFEQRKRVWAPFYVIHKLMAGLIDMRVRCGNAQALEAAKGIAAYFSERFERFSDDDLGKMLDANEEGGISEALWNLYAITNAPEHRKLAERLERRSFLVPMANGDDILNGRHGNTHIPLAVGAIRRYELTGDTTYLLAAEYFWDRVVTPRCYATGGTTNAEVWGEPYRLAKTLSRNNHETCKTYNLLRLSRHLLCCSGDARYGDYYERAFLNGILGTQEPESGMFEYYVPMASGYQRVYGTPFDAFWCCYGTGVETWSKLGDSIYFRNDDALLVNLFISSAAVWEEKGVRIEQATRFPDDEETVLTIRAQSPEAFTLAIRIPSWVGGTVECTINGKRADIKMAAGTVAKITRTWKNGDKVRLWLPMRLTAVPMPDDPNLVAFQYGPVVLAGVLSAGESLAPLFSTDPHAAQPEADAKKRQVFFLADVASDVSWLEPVPDHPLEFRAVGQPFDITFVPFGRVIAERYGLYFPVVPENSVRHRQLIGAEPPYQSREDAAKAAAAQEAAGEVFREVDAGRIDSVTPGDADSERAHALRGEGMGDGPHLGQHWRHAEAWWSWDMAVSPKKKNALRCIYWGSDAGRVFRILVDGVEIAKQELNRDAPDRFFAKRYEIPRKLTKDKQKVTVRFEAVEGYAGGVFGCATTLDEPGKGG